MGIPCFSKHQNAEDDNKQNAVTKTQYRWRIVDNHAPESYDAFVSEIWEDLEMMALANGSDFLAKAANLTDEAKVYMTVKIDTRVVDI